MTASLVPCKADALSTAEVEQISIMRAEAVSA